jgi:SAM-dependent methyltransferase
MMKMCSVFMKGLSTWENKQSEFIKWHPTELDKRFGAYLTRQFFKCVLAHISPDKDAYSLDVGCGSGAYLSQLSSYGFNAVGIDPYIRISYAQLKVLKSWGEFLPFKDNSMALCIVAAALDHVNDPEKVIEEIYRVLLPNGYLFVIQSVRESAEFDPTHMHSFSEKSLKRLLHKFKVISEQKYFCIPRTPFVNFLLKNERLYNEVMRWFQLVGHVRKRSVVLIAAKK